MSLVEVTDPKILSQLNVAHGNNSSKALSEVADPELLRKLNEPDSVGDQIASNLAEAPANIGSSIGKAALGIVNFPAQAAGMTALDLLKGNTAKLLSSNIVDSVIAKGKNPQAMPAQPPSAVGAAMEKLNEPSLSNIPKEAVATKQDYGNFYGKGIENTLENIRKDPARPVMDALMLTGSVRGTLGENPIDLKMPEIEKKVANVFSGEKGAISKVSKAANADTGKVSMFGPVMENGQTVVRPVGFSVGNTAAKSIGGQFEMPAGKGGQVVPPENTGIEDIPANLIKKSIETNTPLASIGDKKITNLLNKAYISDDTANEIISNFRDKTMEVNPQRTIEALNATFGEVSPRTNIEAIQEHYKNTAEPAYKTAMDKGNLALVGKADTPEITTAKTNLAGLIQDPVMQDYIKQVRQGVSGRQLKNLPDTDIRVLDAVKKTIDQDIEGAKSPLKPQKYQAKLLTDFKNELVDNVDRIAPEYKEARRLAGDSLSLMEAQETAKKNILQNRPEDLKAMFDSYTPAEKEAALVGVRDAYLEKIEKAASSDRSNVALKVFSDNETNIGRQKLKAILPPEKYKQLMARIDPLVKEGKNLNAVAGGSQTAERVGLSTRGGINPVRMLEHLGVKTAIKGVKHLYDKRYGDVARLLTDPSYLKQKMGGNIKTSKIGFVPPPKQGAK